MVVAEGSGSVGSSLVVDESVAVCGSVAVDDLGTLSLHELLCLTIAPGVILKRRGGFQVPRNGCCYGT